MSARQNVDPAFLNNIPTTTKVTLTTTTTRILESAPYTKLSSASAALNSSSINTTSSATPTLTPISIDRYQNGYYLYQPSSPPAILFTFLHIFHTCHHFYLSIYLPHILKSLNQRHSYTIPLFVASLFFTLGFASRTISIQHAYDTNLTLYAASLVFIILGPIFVCATLYMLVAHLIEFCLPSGSTQNFLGLTPRLLGKLFIASDVLSFLFQCIGSAIMVANDTNVTSANETGANILLFGLATQLATFTFFLIVLWLFIKRVREGGESVERHGKQPISPNDTATTPDWHHKKAFGMNPLVAEIVKGMSIAGALVEIRSIYRVAEFAMGDGGYPFTHEWMFWVFEAMPMWLVLLALGWYHPVKLLQSRPRAWFVDKHKEIQQ